MIIQLEKSDFTKLSTSIFDLTVNEIKPHLEQSFRLADLVYIESDEIKHFFKSRYLNVNFENIKEICKKHSNRSFNTLIVDRMTLICYIEKYLNRPITILNEQIKCLPLSKFADELFELKQKLIY